MASGAERNGHRGPGGTSARHCVGGGHGRKPKTWINILAARLASELWVANALRIQRAQGRPGGRSTRGPRAEKWLRERKNLRYGGDHTGLPRAMVLRLIGALPGEPCRLPPSPRRCVGITADLRASLGAPGPHHFAVRNPRRSSVSASASTAPRTTFRDDAYAPYTGAGWERGKHDFRNIGSNLFLGRGT